jgi:NAD(P)-dependent dehydrogenase (short-subunit alcohol dehydrogenase family)
MFALTGKIALVTGAAQGNGRAIAVALARAGADLAIFDLADQAERVHETMELIHMEGRNARFYHCDVRVVEGFADLVARVTDDFGRIDILVNNAGISDYALALECTPERWDAAVDLNLRGMFFLSQAVARHMIERGGGGKIINMGSTHGIVATGNAIAYKSSKGGVHSLTRELAFEWIKYGINVNAVAPGPVETPAILAADEALGRTGDVLRADMARRVPLGRRLQADEIAPAFVFLASDAAKAIVGHVLVVDGGQTIF